MNVLQVNFFDTTGGAARISWDLFRKYRQRGHASYLAVGRKVSEDPDVFEIPNERLRNAWSGFWRSVERDLTASHIRLLPGLARLLANVGELRRWQEQRQGIEDFNFPGTASLLDLVPRRPDILHAHVLHSGYFDLRALPLLTSRIPTVITLHDEWMMTGHCAYTLGCKRYESGCGSCPDLTIYPAIKKDATAFNWQRKRAIYENSRLFIATPSQWLMDKVRSSMLTHAIVETRVIPNGVDLTVFHPTEKDAARLALGLPRDAWIALFVAHGARNNKYKDLATIKEAFKEFAANSEGKNLLFICLGDKGEDLRIGANEFRYIDYLSDNNEMSRYYCASDVYVHAARLDNFPNSILEALACGTPVIATAVGGIPEQVEDGETGFLVAAGDSSEIVARMKQLQENKALLASMQVKAADAARRLFSLDIMADNYLRWYNEILEIELSK
jgi:glycosyltransferase involved in cell wall biosynthesis